MTLKLSLHITAVTVESMILESGGTLHVLRGTEDDAVEEAAQFLQKVIDPTLTPHVADRYRDVSTGEWVVHVRNVAGGL